VASSYCPVNTGEITIVDGQARSEARLVSAAKKGHRAAFEKLCERHVKRIFHATLRVTRNHEDAEDALQDSLLSAFVHLGSFDSRSSFSTWLTRIAINSALMKLRKNRGCREVSLDEPAGASDTASQYELPDRHVDPETRYVQREQQRIVAGAVRDLRPKLRRVVEIRELQEESIKETAQKLGISVAAAKGRLFHARAALRRVPRLRAIRQARVGRAA
jgi:RNA polymerase sigma factor (sigma-70 family)